MYSATAVGSIQGTRRFTMQEGEPISSTVAEGEILISNKNSGWDISWFKNPRGLVPLPNQPNLFLILTVIYDFVIQKSNHEFLHILHHFY